RVLFRSNHIVNFIYSSGIYPLFVLIKGSIFACNMRNSFIGVIAFSLTLLFSPALLAQNKADQKVIDRLTKDIWYISSDFMQGRATGGRGEHDAAEYIIRRYETMGIPAYKNNYLQPFPFKTGKELTNTRVWLGSGLIPVPTAAFPLPFSPVQKAISTVLPEVYEPGHIWMMPLYADKEEADNPHFD